MTKKRYHMNYEGKIYPCRATVLKCPYGDNMHADNKEELYYKSMKITQNQDPSYGARQEIALIKRLKSLYRASDEIVESRAPIELIITTLDAAIKDLEATDPAAPHRFFESIKEDGAHIVFNMLRYGMTIPSYVPNSIRVEGQRMFADSGHRVVEHTPISQRGHGYAHKAELENLRKEFPRYEYWEKWKLDENNYQGTLNWLRRDFNKYSHDLNTSKLITQPVFFGDIEKAKEVIKQMDDYELMAAYDDYLVSDKEIEESVAEANYFEYEPRRDLTKEANAKVKEWYDRNKAIFESWKRNTPKRVILSLEMAAELDRRKVKRQDVAVRA